MLSLPQVRAPLVLPRLPVRAAGVILLSLVAFFAGRQLGSKQGAAPRLDLPPGSIRCRPGPWGELAYTPFTIAAPDELLPVRAIEARGTHWFLTGYTADTFVTLLQSTSLSPARQQAFLSPAVLHVQPDGIDLTPAPDMVFSLPDDARAKIYDILAQPSAVTTELNILPLDTLDERFSAGGVSPRTVQLFNQICCRRGNYVLFSGMAALYARLGSYDEKLRFLKSITRQRTMFLHLHITPSSDVDALARYWSKGCWDTDVRTVLQSLTTIPSGTWMNILIILPPLPTAEIYTYRFIPDNPLDGPPIHRDCHWTTFNFFRDKPDPNFGTEAYVRRELQDNYYPVPGDAAYGDVVLFSKPDGTIIHSAVYIADDICFTKDGADPVQPWMLSTISNLVTTYTSLLQPGEKLSLGYYRNKLL